MERESLRQQRKQCDIFYGLGEVLTRVFPQLAQLPNLGGEEGGMANFLRRYLDPEQIRLDPGQIREVLEQLGCPPNVLGEFQWNKILNWGDKIAMGLNPQREMDKFIKNLRQRIGMDPSSVAFCLPSSQEVKDYSQNPQNPPWSAVNRRVANKQPPGMFSSRIFPLRGPGRYSRDPNFFLR